ncbi:hypothetical protein LTR24_004938 [Lithohypha guttulata]|uniref:Zn(2)-C6 fungal-type domain-containing protein n=1 Tax=Lithohypha guttulata TaxID=1690604 RepID=A0ABR0KAG7_9EURO|nr:hypothetical protein LTR24_004938 [Lithohypha guttulata]
MSAGLNNHPPNQHDNEEGRSRLRVSKACTRCRTRKDRCDGLTPCTACRTASKSCTYEATTRKRGLPEGYVRSLEKLITLALHTIGGLEDVLVGYLRDEEVKAGWSTSVGDELYSNWRDSGLYQELETFLQSSISHTNPGKRKRSSEDASSEGSAERLSSMLELLRSRKYRVAEGDSEEEDGGSSLVIGMGYDIPLNLETGTSTALPSNSKDLLDLFFTHVHPWFPVLNQPSVLKLFYGQSRGMPDTSRPNGGLALLWSIFAYAVAIDTSSTEDTGMLSPKYSNTSLRHILAPCTNVEDKDDFDDMHAQALLILALLRLRNGQWLGSWMCTARSVRILLARQSQTAKGVLQGCFILETLLNVHFDNSRSLFPLTLLTDMVEEEGHDEWDTWARHHHAGKNGPSFALSIFNRLTKIFIVLNEALVDPQAAKSPVYIQSKLDAIHRLAKEHFEAGIQSPTFESPPHHIYFQIALLFAQLRLVTSIPREARTHFDLISLATNALSLFEICEKPQIGLNRVPPLFADTLNLTVEVASQIRGSFASSAARPSYEDTIATISRFRSKLTATWSLYRSTTHREDAETGLLAQSEMGPLEAVRTTDYNLEPIPPQPLNSVSTLPDQWAPQQQMPSLASPVYPRNSFNRTDWSVLPQAHQFGTAYPVTSPSFQGDEVDAIFYEMAHLDTNEWMNERTTGLKDFGFNDESAFMDFCNDPERLALPAEAGIMPLSSSPAPTPAPETIKDGNLSLQSRTNKTG